METVNRLPMCGLYKFVYKNTDEIFYIGMSERNIAERIDRHLSGQGLDAKFAKHIRNGYDLYVCELPNKAEIKIMETALINKYKPILNDRDNKPGFSGLIHVDEPEWKRYAPKYEEKEPVRNNIFSRYGNPPGMVFYADGPNIYNVFVPDESKYPFIYNKRMVKRFIKEIAGVCKEQDIKTKEFLINREDLKTKKLFKGHEDDHYPYTIEIRYKNRFGMGFLIVFTNEDDETIRVHPRFLEIMAPILED